MTNQFLLSFEGTKFNTSNKPRNNWKLLFEVNVSKNSTKTIKLFAFDLYKVIVDSAYGLLNYHLIEISSSKSNY